MRYLLVREHRNDLAHFIHIGQMSLSAAMARFQKENSLSGKPIAVTSQLHEGDMVSAMIAAKYLK